MHARMKMRAMPREDAELRIRTASALVENEPARDVGSEARPVIPLDQMQGASSM